MSDTLIAIILTVVVIIILFSLLLNLRRKNLDFQLNQLSSDTSTCQGSWSNWSECSSTCNGTQKRVFNLSQQSLNNGDKCPEPQIQSCNMTCLDPTNINKFFVGNQTELAVPTHPTTIASTNTNNAYICAQTCLNDPICEAYGWVTDTGRCDLYDFRSAALLDFEQGGLPNYQIGVQVAESRKIVDESSFNKVFNRDNQSQFGPTLDPLTSALGARIGGGGIDEYTCGELCLDDSSCVSYGYFTDTNVCDLYYTKQTQVGQPIWKNYRVGKKRSAGHWN